MTKILSWNIRSWYRDIKHDDRHWLKRAKLIKEYIEQQMPDIICLQEALFPMVQLCIPKGYKKATGLSVSHHIYCRTYCKVDDSSWNLHFASAIIRNADQVMQVFSVHGHWDADKTRQIENNINATIDFKGLINHIAIGDWNREHGDVVVVSLPFNYGHGKTFRNWDTGAEGSIDYSLSDVKPVMLPTMTIDEAMPYSDHRPIMIEI